MLDILLRGLIRLTYLLIPQCSSHILANNQLVKPVFQVETKRGVQIAHNRHVTHGVVRCHVDQGADGEAVCQAECLDRREDHVIILAIEQERRVDPAVGNLERNSIFLKPRTGSK